MEPNAPTPISRHVLGIIIVSTTGRLLPKKNKGSCIRLTKPIGINIKPVRILAKGSIKKSNEANSTDTSPLESDPEPVVPCSNSISLLKRIRSENL